MKYFVLLALCAMFFGCKEKDIPERVFVSEGVVVDYNCNGYNVCRANIEKYDSEPVNVSVNDLVITGDRVCLVYFLCKVPQLGCYIETTSDYYRSEQYWKLCENSFDL